MQNINMSLDSTDVELLEDFKGFRQTNEETDSQVSDEKKMKFLQNKVNKLIKYYYLNLLNNIYSNN